MSKNFFIALCGLTIAAVSASVFTSCGNTTKQQGLEAVQDSAQVSYEGLLSTLDSLGYTYEAHPLVGYFKITKGNSGANVDINPDGSLSYFLYNHDNATDEDRAFTQLAVAAFESAGFKDNGPGEDSSDNLLTPIDETKAFDEAALEAVLKEQGIDVEYRELKGAHFLSLKTKNGVEHHNGKANTNLNADGTASFFSDDTDSTFAAGIIQMYESFGFTDTGKGPDGSTHYFKP